MRVDRRLVGGDLVAAPDPAAGAHRGGLGDADELEREVPVWGGEVPIGQRHPRVLACGSTGRSRSGAGAATPRTPRRRGRRLHEHRLRLHAGLRPARALPPPRRDVGGYDVGRRRHLRLARPGAADDRLHLRLGGARAADPRRLDRHRSLAPARPAALLARVRPRPRAVPPPLPRHAAVRDRRARLRPRTAPARSTRPRSSSASSLAVVVSFGFRFLYNVGRVLAARLPRRRARSSAASPLLLRAWRCRSRSSRAGSRASRYALPFASIIQAPIDVWLGKHTGSTSSAVLALQVALGAGAARARARLLLARGDAEGGGAGWLRRSSSGCAARRRAGAVAAAVPRLVRARRHRLVPDLVPRLPRLC